MFYYFSFNIIDFKRYCSKSLSKNILNVLWEIHCRYEGTLLTRYVALTYTAHVDEETIFIFMIRRWTSKFVIQIICKPMSRYLWCHLLFSKFLIFSSLGRAIDSETSCKRHVCHQLFVRNCLNHMCWHYMCEFFFMEFSCHL